MPHDQLKDALEKELVNMVNQVGVDINFCIEHPHAEGLVPFLSGFGPRKATVLLKVYMYVLIVTCPHHCVHEDT